jgi:hypothetical protein
VGHMVLVDCNSNSGSLIANAECLIRAVRNSGIGQ